MFAYDIQQQKVQIETFDGPLELLLYLVRREGVDIRDVPITNITDAYLESLETLELLDLDTAGDFLLMASTLCYLKSRELLHDAYPPPSDTTPSAEEDPIAIRERLRKQLIDYRRFKEASVKLGQHLLRGRDIFCRPKQQEEIRPLQAPVDAIGLLQIFRSLLEREQEPQPVHTVQKARYSMKEMSQWILQHLLSGRKDLKTLLKAQDNKADRVVCFLSILELARHAYLDFSQEKHLSPMTIIPNFTDTIPDLSIKDYPTPKS